MPKQFGNKFDMKFEKGIMIGYITTGYMLWNLKKEQLIVSWDVVFKEEEFFHKNKSVSIDIGGNDEKVFENGTNMEQDAGDEQGDRRDEQELENESEKHKRILKLPEKYKDYEMYIAFDAMAYVENIPENINELENRDDKELWIGPMEREIESIKRNNTRTKVQLPQRAEILNTRWVFASKPLEERMIDRYKARLVVRGFA
ncbi:hypothetical protein AMK59_2687 [Oryctes borbonicus]|uniref:Retroviral polymerase SH3-like domain-containing protein n=1 Tax=Oryctes borbonicus TaxID=1629725 RepID=A0A0T6BHL3_9SCAR|nr:hypothetical protein AMK59_2687 [Oryctes borbonicus]